MLGSHWAARQPAALPGAAPRQPAALPDAACRRSSAGCRQRVASHAGSTTRAAGADGAGAIVREVLTSAQRQKQDGVSDREFYSTPRFVTHVDRTFLRQLTELYRQRIPAGSAVLDIGASHISHLPPGVAYKEVVGHGLNATELARNPALSRFFVRDLNTDPDGWALADQSFDAVTCCVSVQYLQQPERVFCEVYRVLKPGGCAIFAFSTRMFASKAIAAWRDGTSYSRVSLVRSYFQAVRGFSAPELVTSVPLADDTLLDKLWSLLAGGEGDPFFAVIAQREP